MSSDERESRRRAAARRPWRAGGAVRPPRRPDLQPLLPPPADWADAEDAIRRCSSRSGNTGAGSSCTTARAALAVRRRDQCLPQRLPVAAPPPPGVATYRPGGRARRRRAGDRRLGSRPGCASPRSDRGAAGPRAGGARPRRLGRPLLRAAAAALDVPVGTVRSRLSRARARLTELTRETHHDRPTPPPEGPLADDARERSVPSCSRPRTTARRRAGLSRPAPRPRSCWSPVSATGPPTSVLRRPTTCRSPAAARRAPPRHVQELGPTPVEVGTPTPTFGLRRRPAPICPGTVQVGTRFARSRWSTCSRAPSSAALPTVDADLVLLGQGRQVRALRRAGGGRRPPGPASEPGDDASTFRRGHQFEQTGDDSDRPGGRGSSRRAPWRPSTSPTRSPTATPARDDNHRRPGTHLVADDLHLRRGWRQRDGPAAHRGDHVASAPPPRVQRHRVILPSAACTAARWRRCATRARSPTTSRPSTSRPTPRRRKRCRRSGGCGGTACAS